MLDCDRSGGSGSLNRVVYYGKKPLTGPAISPRRTPMAVIKEFVQIERICLKG
jgi:hypothetical protein